MVVRAGMIAGPGYAPDARSDSRAACQRRGRRGAVFFIVLAVAPELFPEFSLPEAVSGGARVHETPRSAD